MFTALQNSSIVASEDDEHLIILAIMITSNHTVVSCTPTLTDCPTNATVPTKLPEEMSKPWATETMKLFAIFYPIPAVEALSLSILSVATTGDTAGKTLTSSQIQSVGNALMTMTVKATNRLFW